MLKRIRHFLVADEAATMVEYAVMLALIILAMIGTIGQFGSNTSGLWGNTNTQLNSHGFGS
jgi:pilus assembly protein Flp/PilA